MIEPNPSLNSPEQNSQPDDYRESHAEPVSKHFTTQAFTASAAAIVVMRSD
jgi:hypothetical protein